LIATREVDIADGALITRAPREPRTASTLASCLVSIRCHISGFTAAVKNGRALRAVGVADEANGALITHSPRISRTASTLTRCPVSISCHISSFTAAVNGALASCARGIGDAANRTRFRNRVRHGTCVRLRLRSRTGFRADVCVRLRLRIRRFCADIGDYMRLFFVNVITCVSESVWFSVPMSVIICVSEPVSVFVMISVIVCVCELIFTTRFALDGIIHIEVPSYTPPLKALISFVNPDGHVVYPCMDPSEALTRPTWVALYGTIHIWTPSYTPP